MERVASGGIISTLSAGEGLICKFTGESFGLPPPRPKERKKKKKKGTEKKKTKYLYGISSSWGFRSRLG